MGFNTGREIKTHSFSKQVHKALPETNWIGNDLLHHSPLPKIAILCVLAELAPSRPSTNFEILVG
jgi:hypothetical protein